MHSMIYFGFLVLLGVTTVLEIDHQLPEDLKFLHGRTYHGVLVHRRPRRSRVPGRHRVGDRRVATCSGRTASASSRSPSTRSSSARSSSSRVSGFMAEAFRIALERSAALREVELHRLPAEPAVRRRCPRARSSCGTRSLWVAHVVAFIVFLAILPITMLRHMFTSPLNMYLQGPRASEGRDEGDAEPHRDVARDVRCVGRRGLHVEAVARHRRLHDVRPLHVRVPGARHRQAARPTRDRAQDRRGDGRHRRRTATSARRSASTRRSRSPPTRCSSGSPPRRSGRARRARRATRSARSTSRSSTRSSTCGATCR